MITNLEVDSASTAWTVGPMVYPGECLQIQTAGYVRVAVIRGGGTDYTDPETYYALPEGAYPPDYPSSHDLQPSLVAGYEDHPGVYPATNTVPFSLAVVIQADGLPPPPYGVANALRPNRDTTYTAQQVADAGGTIGPYRAWLIFNDAQGAFNDNSGTFSVTLTRTAPEGAFDMSDRFSITQGVQIGKESTHGTPASASVRLKSSALAPKPMGAFKGYRPEGYKRKSILALTKEWSEANLSGLANYTELGYWLDSLVGNRATSPDGGGSYEHVWISSRQDLDNLSTFTCEIGSAEGCERFPFGFVSALGFKMNRDDIELTGHLYGGKLQNSSLDSISLSQGPSEVHTVTVNGSPTGGTFTLTFNDATTAAIDHAATGSAVQSALQALATIGTGNATVSGSAGGPWVVAFAGALAHKDVGPLTADASGLTGGVTPTVTVAQTQIGGMTELPHIPILPGEVDVYLSDTVAGLDSSGSQLLRSFDCSWNFGERTKPFWTQNSTASAFSGFAETEPKEMLDLLLGADAQGLSLMAAARTDARKYIRICATSKSYAIGALPYKFQLDASVKVSAFKEFKDDQGVYSIGYELQVVDDADWGKSYQFYLRNGVASY